MDDGKRTTRFGFWLWLIRLIGVIVPRRLRADWRQEWEAELRYREARLDDWDRLNWRNKLDLLWRSTSAFWDALWMQTYRWEDAMIQDLRFGLRMLVKNPGFAFTAVLLLALGIGANTAIFSVADAIMLKMLPVKEPEQLVLLSRVWPSTRGNNFAYSSYERFRDQDSTLSGVLAYYPVRLTVSVDGQPEPAINGQLVTGSYYQVLGVNAALGRTISPDDDRVPGAHPVCVISDSYWRQRFGREAGVVGRTIHLGGYPFTVIGVTPPEFFGLEVGTSMDISVPLMMQEQARPGIRSLVSEQFSDRLRLLGRLRPGATAEQAQASLGSLHQQYVADWFERNKRSPKGADPSDLEEKLLVTSGSQGLSDLRRQFSQPLFILMTVVALVLLIACANVGGLILSRGVARRKEMAIRQALGAGRQRLVRQLLTESVMLAGVGGVLGLLFAWWGARLLLPLLLQGEIPAHLSFNPDLRILGFTAAVAVLTGILFGLAPAFLAARVDLQSALKQDSQAMGSHTARLGFGQVFVVAQVAFSLLLLVGAGLFVRSLEKLQRVETGFARENVLVLRLEPVGSDNKNRVRPKLTAFYDELVQHLEAMPGVRQASLVGYSPISRSEWLVTGDGPDMGNPMYVEGYTPRSAQEMEINWMQVYPNSFSALGIPLVTGRDFDSEDSHESQAVAVINESMARGFFGDENPVGRRFGFAVPIRSVGIEIIGVVKDAIYKSLREPSRPMFYLPFSQAGTGRGQMTLVVRTAGDPGPVVDAMRREVRALDPGMPMFEVETLNTQIAASLSQERLVATLSSVFGVLALFLACIGLYGVMAYDVTRRTREIGIRMALGATARQVVELVLGETLWLVGIGVVIGLGAALIATRWVESLLFGLQPHDPLTIGLAVLVLLAVAALAGYLPARRASRVDPMVALRHD
jgi:putative ABC transport system permease protein